MVKTLLVAGGGAFGANLRYWIGGWLAEFLEKRWVDSAVWNNFAINVTGSLIIGLFMGLSFSLNWNPNWRLLVATGVLGGYTTYSSFAYDAVNLLSHGEYVRGLIYIQGTAICTVFSAWLGLVGARILLGGKG